MLFFLDLASAYSECHKWHRWDFYQYFWEVPDHCNLSCLVPSHQLRPARKKKHLDEAGIKPRSSSTASDRSIHYATVPGHRQNSYDKVGPKKIVFWNSPFFVTGSNNDFSFEARATILPSSPVISRPPLFLSLAVRKKERERERERERGNNLCLFIMFIARFTALKESFNFAKIRFKHFFSLLFRIIHSSGVTFLIGSAELMLQHTGSVKSHLHTGSVITSITLAVLNLDAQWQS